MNYLLKRCGHQELGSMDATLTPQRGQYLLMANRSEVLSFFPPLSTTTQNDFRLVLLYPVYTRDSVYCRFVYHNDKYHGSTALHPRNEHRLYLNREVQGGRLMFRKDGIVVIRMVDESNYENGLYIDYADPDEPKYEVYNALLNGHQLEGSGGNYAVYSGEIKILEDEISRFSMMTRELKVASEDIRYITKSKTDISQLFTEKQFRDFVSVAYQYKCAITGTVIAYEDMNNLETAHIRPKSHGGPFLPCNGMTLCRDFHWAFDHGFLALTDDFHVLVSKKAPSPLLLPYDNKPIFIPEEPFFQPKLEYVQYHRKNIFEHFAQIRSSSK